MLGVELVANKEKKLPFPAETNIAERIAEACLAEGVIVRPVGNWVIASPPLIMSAREGSTIVEALQHTVSEVSR